MNRNLYFLCLCLCMWGNIYGDDISKLAIALNNIASQKISSSQQAQPTPTKQTQSSTSELLGPWMLKNHPKDLVAHDANFRNTGAPVYQIKVLKQWKGDCWIHSFRNCLFIMDLALSRRKNFSKPKL